MNGVPGRAASGRRLAFRVDSASDLDRVPRSKRPGDRATLGFRRPGGRMEASVTLVADARIELVPAAATGTPPTPGQRAFR